MSNDESAMAAGSPIRFKTCVGAALSSLALRDHTTWFASTAGCPSGQWKRTVNPSVYTYAGSNPAPATSQTSQGATARPRSSWVTAGHGDSRAQDNPSATYAVISGVAVLTAATSP